MLHSNQYLCCKHLAGAYNVVSDFLTFTSEKGVNSMDPLAYDNPPNCTFTQHLHSHLSQLIPQNFNITPLSSNIMSFALRALQMIELSVTHNKRR
mmetsp:Transcript_38184/g.43581  ORF Transcript_38184/g.43581 Transcript_38184/m.43581 type:complete len:95 (-) Transcript_38184:425-709(-)